MGKIRNLNREPIIFPLMVVTAVLSVAVIIGQRIGTVGVNYQDILVLLVIVAAVIIALQRRGLEIGLLIWIGMFAVGYRSETINVPMFVDWLLSGGTMSRRYLTTGMTPTITIHPLTIIIIILFLLLILQSAKRRNLNWHIPALLLPFSVFWILGWLQGLYFGFRWYFMLPELLMFLLMFPVFLVTGSLLQREEFWKPVAVTFFAIGAVIAALGLLEYLVPESRNLVPGFIINPDAATVVEQDGFVRAIFSFWGEQTAIFVSVLGLCLIIPLWQWYPNRRSRILIVIGILLDLGGIYIAGWRTLWFLTPLVFIAIL